MLIRFEVANFRSILEPAELSLVAIDRERAEARPAESLGESLLAVAAIYGPNASGKSNVLAALAWLQTALRDSLRSWEDGVPLQTFAFAGGERPTHFAVDWLIKGVRFEYVLSIDDGVIRYEALFHYPARKRRRVFERDGQDLVLQRGLGGRSGTRELMTPSTLVLSITQRLAGERLIAAFSLALLRLQAIDQGGQRSLPARSTLIAEWPWAPEGAAVVPIPPGSAWGQDREADRARALALLRLADLGIDDVAVDRAEATLRPGDGSEMFTDHYRTRLLHRTANGAVALDLDQESDGTRAWFQVIGPVLKALSEGSVLLLDELDASLHPTVSAELIRLFHDPTTNPAGAQLIFTSHDTSLLNHLNRDEVWFTEKGEDGSTRLGALSDFAGERVRRSKNLERAYLHGRFGALPDSDRTDVLRALGLIA